MFQEPREAGPTKTADLPKARPGWLGRGLHRLFTLTARTYYQVRAVGGAVPPEGPVLLVANHPNSLLDPTLLAFVAQRPVRFLAGGHLFRRRGLAWAVRGSGAIPVYRRSDEPEEMGKNLQAFAAVRDALLGGAVVGVFPEGFTHSEPALVPLKTGAARMALLTAHVRGESFPILPVGITYRGGKERFRSEALVVVGKPVRWDDLATDPEAPEAVRALTDRIEAALSRLIVNLSDWEDLPVVEMAEAVHEAEFGRIRQENPVRWLARMQRTARALEAARRRGLPERMALGEALLRHRRLLEALSLTPTTLHHRPRGAQGVRWTLRNLFFFGVTLPLAGVGSVVFWLPWTVVVQSEPRFRLDPHRQATYRVLGVFATGGSWVGLLALGAFHLEGWRVALALALLLPLLGLVTLRIRWRWREATAELRRFLVLRGRLDLGAELMKDQRELAEGIRGLLATLDPPG